MDLYGRIVKMLAVYGEILTPFVADPKVTAQGTDEGTATTDRKIHDRDVRLLNECDGKKTLRHCFEIEICLVTRPSCSSI